MLIEEAKVAGAWERMACKELGINQRTLQRWRRTSQDQRPCAKRPFPGNKLSEEETRAVIEVANHPEFQSLPPSQIVPFWLTGGSIWVGIDFLSHSERPGHATP